MDSYSPVAMEVVGEFYRPELPTEENVLEYLQHVEVSPFDTEAVAKYQAVRSEMEARIAARGEKSVEDAPDGTEAAETPAEEQAAQEA